MNPIWKMVTMTSPLRNKTNVKIQQKELSSKVCEKVQQKPYSLKS
jgi:hypothetical protein